MPSRGIGAIRHADVDSILDTLAPSRRIDASVVINELAIEHECGRRYVVSYNIPLGTAHSPGLGLSIPDSGAAQAWTWLEHLIAPNGGRSRLP